MKNLLIFAFSFLASTSVFCQNEWASVGSTWYYECSSVFSPPHTESVIVTGDTTIMGQNCRKIKEYGEKFTYEDNGKVFIFNPSDNTFGLLYNFNTQPGSSWKIKLDEYLLWPFDSLTIMVDNIVDREVSGQIVQTQLVSYFSDQGEWLGMDSIFENIGCYSNKLLAPFTFYNPDSIVDEGGPCRLRCFEIPKLGVLNFHGQSCIYSNSDDLQLGETQILVSPNPAKEQILVTLQNYRTVASGKFVIYDLWGRPVKELEKPFESEKMDISLPDLGTGLYFLKYEENGLVLAVERFIISK